MTNHEIDDQLAAARPAKTPVSAFTSRVMAALAKPATFASPDRRTNATKWSFVMNYLSHHKITAISAAGVLLASLSLSGYAYAQGTDPVSLVKRWVTGQQVNIAYQGHTYEHGVHRSYSDAAVSAFAELQTVSSLHFKAVNAFTRPQAGFEHVSRLAPDNFQYPRVGTITRIDSTMATIQIQYLLGDKTRPSGPLDQQLSVPLAELSLYRQGEPATADRAATGNLVVFYQDPYWRHQTGSSTAPAAVVHYFAFELKHPLAAIQEADQANQGPLAKNTADVGLYEPSWGGISNICLNNGADSCDSQNLPTDQGQGLYTMQVHDLGPKDARGIPTVLPTTHLTNNHNPGVVPFSELAPDVPSPDLLVRNLEGRITSLQNGTITIKTSSGALWQLTPATGLLHQFKTNWKSPLKIGDRVGGSVVCPINDLDNRSFDNAHIYALKRF